MKTLKSNIELYKPTGDSPLDLPFSEAGIAAGFPSPADDYIDLTIDLNRELIKNPSSTFLARVKGVSMIEEGIEDGDLLIIDKSVEPTDRCLAVAFIDGAFTLKRVKIAKDGLYLMPANKDYRPIKITADDDFTIWGVVKYLIKKK